MFKKQLVFTKKFLVEIWEADTLREELNRKKSYNEYFHHFSKFHDISNIEAEYENAHLFFKENIEKYLPKISSASFIDLGCGLGHTLYSLKKLGYVDTLGIDINSDCINFCKQKDFNVKKTSILDFLKNSTKKFDVILAFDVIEHFHKDEATKIVELIKTRLKKNGLMLLLLPNANNLSNFRLRYMDITHEVFYTPESITQLIRNGGFDNFKIIGLRYFTVSSKSKKWALTKSFLALPAYLLSEFFHKIFYLSIGLTEIQLVSPKMLVLCIAK